MIATALQPKFDQETFEAFIAEREEPDWLIEQRRAAWSTFCEMDWPDRRAEEWIRTDIRLFHLDRYAPAVRHENESSLPDAVLTEGVQLAGASQTLDGVPAKACLDSKWSEKGVVFGSLSQMVCERPDLIAPHLMTRAVSPDLDRFAALHAAFWSGGHVLYVPRGVVVDLPFHMFSAMSNGSTDLGHTLVILEEGAEATVMSETASYSESDDGLHVGAIELLVAPGANLRFVNLQDWGHGVWNFAHHKALVDRDASLQWTIAALGCRLSKVNQHVGLIGPGANSQVNGVLFTEGKQHLSYHTLQHHEAPDCRSDFLYKAALQDKSRTVWRGMIKVDPGAQKTDGYQRNDNLLLSNKARADSIPGLEIEADDVRCTHGSTSGKVDEELIFYAMCRGFTRKEATRMIVSGFFQQIFDRITIESVRDALAHAISARVREYE